MRGTVKRCVYIYQDTVGLTTLMTNTSIITTVITLSLYELAAGHLCSTSVALLAEFLKTISVVEILLWC